MRRLARVSLVVALLATPFAPRAGAQASPAGPAPQMNAVFGEVVHDQTGLPLAGATVLLITAGPGALSAGAGAGPFVQGSRVTGTDATGHYRFDGVAPGSYVLRITRLGFRPATIDVVLGGSDARVSVGLPVVPVRLQPVEVTTESPEPYARHADSAAGEAAARAAAIAARQRRYLSTDVREITHSDVTEGVTLAETDLFRALQRLPGVATRNEFSAELWTRGARWDQTRVLFDGLPLFDPLHAAGSFGAVSPDAIGAAFLHPGVRPASIGEGGAAVLDLRSRPGGGAGELRGVGELSMVSARAALDRRMGDGRGTWMVAGRRTYLDLLLPHVVSGVDGRFPYHFSELVTRVDRQLDGGRLLEASALYEQDRLSGDVPDVTTGNRASWGNLLVRGTLQSTRPSARYGDLVVRQTAGLSRYHTGIGPGAVDAETAARYSGATFPSLSASILYLTVTGDVAPVVAGLVPTPWSAGYELVHERADGQTIERATTRSASLSRLGVWGERRLQPLPRISVLPGLRAELGNVLRGTGPLRVSPRLSARYAPGDSTTFVSAAVGRSYQYTQSLPGVVKVHDASGEIVPVWLLADGATPALQSDIATIGIERWLGAEWHAALNAYARHASGVLVPDPRTVSYQQLLAYVEGQQTARGAEAALRRVAGRWTVAAGYAWGVSRTTAAGLEFPSPEDRTRSFDLTTMVRVGRGLHLGAAYEAATGAPFTRRVAEGKRFEADGTVTIIPGHYEEPGGGRMPGQANLDLLLDWSGIVRGTRLGLYVQLHNATGRRNAISYEGTASCGSSPGCPTRDLFQEGLPMVPLVGLRASF